ncbi:CPBP family intramembrane metalloprotease [Haloferax sp. MBLA0076]|uniref:CPBP family intramembrane metalloprotease n=1 Tax=Haloferax litoreum TaxID=2666140 RepID=A0A6A8GHE1_9EURY|nr:CPBP family intramembrane metalloprotease [Haloferax sp. CBA1148]MRX22326.1 CPBP family intramembrane metalloprotease [Haloferax litoreum]
MRPWGFPLIYLGWAFVFWAPILVSETSVWSFPNVLFFLVGGASPLLAGVTLALLTGGTERLRGMWRRLTDVQRISPKWLVTILLFWPAFNLLVAGAALALGVSDRPLDIVWGVLTDPETLAFMLVLSFVFPLVEEIGLRGYYLDALQERFSPTVAGLINGGTWAVWHAPFVYFPGYYANTTFNPELWWWLPSIVLQTLLIVWVYNNTQRSVLAVLLFHGLMNLTGEFLGLAPEMFPFLLVGTALAAMAVVVSWRRSQPTVSSLPAR